MEKPVPTLDWRPIVTAPPDTDLELSVQENGEYHALIFPCRRDGSGWRGCQAAVPGTRAHAAPFDRIRVGGSRNGYAAAPALSRTRLDHQYGQVHGDVAGAVQEHLALISAWPVRGTAWRLSSGWIIDFDGTMHRAPRIKQHQHPSLYGCHRKIRERGVRVLGGRGLQKTWTDQGP